MERLVEEGKTSWRLARADRLAFLVDGRAYFDALADALAQARRSIQILGWAIDSRLVLKRGEDAGHEGGVGLAELLNRLLCARPRLHANVLCWDYSIVFAFEREALQRVKMGWATHDRLHFVMDDRHPMGASHHEKVVVIDDRLAFIGGLDLTSHRWDVRSHPATDPRRVGPAGRSYRPFHDLQAVVSGDIAGVLGDLCRERWERAVRQTLPVPDNGGDNDPWPGGVEPAIRDIRVGVARTRAEFEDHAGARETENFLLRAVAQARKHIYMENQYFTSVSVGEALERRLAESDPPEILVVTAAENAGWLEQATMGVRRESLCRRLRDADRKGRFAIMAPTAAEGDSPNVHSKLLIVDDRAFYLGSANLANRSMGLDSEAGLVAEAGGREDVEQAIRAFRRELLGEHLGVAAAAVAEEESASGSILAAIERLRGEQGSLQPLDTRVPEWQRALAPLASLTDPEQPLSLTKVLDGTGLAPEDG